MLDASTRGKRWMENPNFYIVWTLQQGVFFPLPPQITLWINPPPPAFIKINFDRSINNSLASSRYILHDKIGGQLKEGASYYGHTSILVAEVRALREGVISIVQKAINKIIIEGSNQIVIQALKGNIQIPWQISNIIEDLRTWWNQCT